jgi:hypothetical protein
LAGGMQNSADLAGPLGDIRDVVESFRTWEVTLPDWDAVLGRAVAVIAEIPLQADLGSRLSGLIPDLRLLQERGLDAQPQVVNRVADLVADALAQARIPGIPAPDDEDWSFGET